MKKITTILAAAILFISASSFALGSDPVSTKIRTAFERNFTAASNVTWQKVNENYLAIFELNNQDLSAMYNEEGELLGTSRTVQLSQIPLSIVIALQDQYPHYTFGNAVTEITVSGDSYYTIKGSNEKNILTLKATPSGNLSVQNKIRKK